VGKQRGPFQGVWQRANSGFSEFCRCRKHSSWLAGWVGRMGSPSTGVWTPLVLFIPVMGPGPLCPNPTPNVHPPHRGGVPNPPAWWNLAGFIAQQIDRRGSSPLFFQPTKIDLGSGGGSHHPNDCLLFFFPHSGPPLSFLASRRFGWFPPPPIFGCPRDCQETSPSSHAWA